MQLLPTVSRSSDSATSSGNSGRPSNRSAASEVSLTRQPSTVNVVTQQTKHRYKSFEHHLLPEHARPSRNHTRDMFGELYPRSNTGGGRGTDASLGTLQTSSSTSSWGESGPTSPLRTIIPSNPIMSSPVSTPVLTVGHLPPSPLAEKRSKEDYFDHPNTKGTVDSIQTKELHHDDGAEGSLMSPVLAPLSPEQSPPGLSRQHVRHHNHRHYLRGSHKHHSHDLQPDLIIEHVFNPKAAEELTPFTFVPGEDDGDEQYYDEEDLSGLQLDAEPEAPNVHRRRWSRIRRRVISSRHRGKTALDSNAPSSAVY